MTSLFVLPGDILSAWHYTKNIRPRPYFHGNYHPLNTCRTRDKLFIIFSTQWQRMRWLEGIINDSIDIWVWANSGRQWRTRKPGVLQFMGSQTVGHDFTTEQQEQHSTYQNLKQLVSHVCYLSPPPECRLHVCRGSFFLVLLYTSALGQAWFIQNIPSIIDSCTHSSHVTVLDVEGKQFLSIW